MIRRLGPTALLLALIAAPLGAQMPLVTAPPGTIRGTPRAPNAPPLHLWGDGGGPLRSAPWVSGGAKNLVLVDLQAELATVLGQPVPPSLG